MGKHGDEKKARLLRALAREGIEASAEGPVWSIRRRGADGPPAEVLLPAELPVESKAFAQLADLAGVRHPAGGECRVCASPDFHPGDSGIAIGSVIGSADLVVPAAVGTDINCGMRLHTTGLSVDQFEAIRADFVAQVRGDLFLGTRDVTQSAAAMRAMFAGGLPGWVLALQQGALGCMARADLAQIERELDRVHLGGSLPGDPAWAPEDLIPAEGLVRDGGLGTVGGGNHFVEIQWVEEILDRGAAYRMGVRAGEVAIMIHSGSRNVGKHVGGQWRDRCTAAWPRGLRWPESKIFPLSRRDTPDLCDQYLEAEATAANYGFANRQILAEILRLRLRGLCGDLPIPLVYDLPHNITLREGGVLRSRKGACPAHPGQPVIIPGSMGDASWLLEGLGAERWQSSASHGAGRIRSRFDMAHLSPEELGLDGVTCVTLKSERRVEEAPAAYKPIQPVIDAQVAQGMVKPVARLRPILTFKA